MTEKCLPTPYDSFGAGAVLMEALRQIRISHNVCDSNIQRLAQLRTNLIAYQDFLLYYVEVIEALKCLV